MATTDATKPESTKQASANFIRDIITEDRANGKFLDGICTRFPPEPNGYLHLGHAKSICLNFGLPKTFGGKCHLRFDDTNPVKEDTEYVESIKTDVKWLGGDWGENLHYTSDYFDTLYDYAEHLIKNGNAFVDDCTPEEIKEMRGNLSTPGTNSPWRERPMEESLAEFRKMKEGAYKNGEKVLRAKIDMSHGNMNMRDPIIYRIAHAHHHRTGDKWCIYPMYDFAHGQGDALEHITHSICTLEFELHRPLYEWFVNNLPVPSQPRQIEMARLNITSCVMSKRKLMKLVEEKVVSGWDDPRMPTISGMRRRGYTPQAIQNFCELIGVTKRESMIEYSLLEHCVSSDLEANAARRMVVMDPLKVEIVNWPEDVSEWTLEAKNHPDDKMAHMGTRQITLSKYIYIERDDFMEDPPKKFFRLAPGVEVRLRYGCYIKAVGVEKDADGKITLVKAEFDPESRGGTSADGRKIKGTIHWVDCNTCFEIEARLYDNLFKIDNPEDLKEGQTSFMDNVNPDSLEVKTVYAEAALKEAKDAQKFQFERKGFFSVDNDSTPEKVVVNRVIPLKDSYAKEDSKEDAAKAAAKEAEKKKREEAAAKRAEKAAAKEKKEKEKAEKKAKKAAEEAAAAAAAVEKPSE